MLPYFFQEVFGPFVLSRCVYVTIACLEHGLFQDERAGQRPKKIRSFPESQRVELVQLNAREEGV